MRGLLRNNFYASLSNMKIFTAVMALLGVFVVAVDNAVQTLLIGYLLLCMVGFSINAVTGLLKENASKWGKYKLTFPVRRMDIVKSYFLSQLIWLAAGIAMAALAVVWSFLLHGNPFDRNIDILMVFTAGISVSLFLDAIFFPLIYLGGEERNEAVLVISLLGGAGLFLLLVSLLNHVFGADREAMTTAQTAVCAVIILLCAAAAFALSYPLSARIFQKKEY